MSMQALEKLARLVQRVEDLERRVRELEAQKAPTEPAKRGPGRPRKEDGSHLSD